MLRINTVHKGKEHAYYVNPAMISNVSVHETPRVAKIHIYMEGNSIELWVYAIDESDGYKPRESYNFALEFVEVLCNPKTDQCNIDDCIALLRAKGFKII